MANQVPFEHVLSFLQEHGYEFTGISRPYRVFNKPGKLPILVEVHDKMVSIEYVRKIKQIIDKEESEGRP